MAKRIFTGSISIADVRDGQDGKSSSVRKLDTHVRKTDSAKWALYSQSGRRETWDSIANVRDFNTGDTAYLEGIITDRGNVGCMLFGEVVGKNGSDITLKTTAFVKDGNNGTDAYSVELTPSEIVFETDINGIVLNPSARPSHLTVRKGTSVVQPSSVSITRLEGCTARFESGRVIITSLAQRDGMSVGAGYVNLCVTAAGNTFEKQLVFSVNIQKFTSEIAKKADSIESRVEEYKRTTDGEISKTQSLIEQTSGSIRLEVNTMLERVNLIENTDFSIKPSVSGTPSGGKIEWRVSREPDTMHNGRTGLYVESEGNASETWVSIRFGAELHIGRQYTFSCWMMSTDMNSIDSAPYLELDYRNTDDSRKWVADTTTALNADGRWERVSLTFTPTEADCLLFIGLPKNGKLHISEPQLEEGAVPTPWTPGRSNMPKALKRAGLDIDLEKFIATTDNFVIRNSKGEDNLLVDEHGMVNAKLIKARTLETLNQGRGSVRAENGVLEVLNPQGKVNIRFGLVNGQTVLAYYDNSGKLLYTLGPDGMSARDITEEKFTEKTFAEINPTVYPVAKMEDIVSNGSLMRALFARMGSHTGNALRDVILYQYTAGRVGNEFVRGLWADTPSQAIGANGRYFLRVGNVASTPNARGFFAETSYTWGLIGAVPQDYSRYERFYAVKVNFNQGSFKRKILVLLDGLPTTVEVYSNTIY